MAALDQALDVLCQAGAWREELIQLVELLAERADRRLHPLPRALPVPLRVRGHDSRAEIGAVFGVFHDGSPWIHREDVLWHHLALGESQSTTTAAAPIGQRYVSGTSRVLLIVREQRQRDGRPGGPTEPFVCLGFARYESHEGERIWFVTEWRSAGGWNGRFRRRGCTAVVSHTCCCLA